MVVNDIEQMRADFDKKLAHAIKENEINEGLNDYRLTLTENNRIYIPSEYITCKGFVKPSIKNVADLLSRFPKTRNTLYGNHNEFDLPYVCYSRRGYGDKNGELHISWTHNEYEVAATMVIDEFIDEFFNVDCRETVDSENSTYATIQRYNEHGHYCKYKVPVYNFKKKQRCYYGGSRLLLDCEEIERLVEFIKSRA